MAAHHPTELARRVLRTPGLGHVPALLSSEARGRCRFSQATFAGMHSNGRDAPKAALPALARAGLLSNPKASFRF
jgi:hypothetical protein